MTLPTLKFYFPIGNKQNGQDSPYRYHHLRYCLPTDGPVSNILEQINLFQSEIQHKFLEHDTSLMMAQFLCPLPANQLALLPPPHMYRNDTLAYNNATSLPFQPQGQIANPFQQSPDYSTLVQATAGHLATQNHSSYNQQSYLSSSVPMGFSPGTDNISADYSQSALPVPNVFGNDITASLQSRDFSVISPEVNRSVNTSMDSGLDSPGVSYDNEYLYIYICFRCSS